MILQPQTVYHTARGIVADNYFDGNHLGALDNHLVVGMLLYKVSENIAVVEFFH